jgi:hypothetical protein
LKNNWKDKARVRNRVILYRRMIKNKKVKMLWTCGMDGRE